MPAATLGRMIDWPCTARFVTTPAASMSSRVVQTRVGARSFQDRVVTRSSGAAWLPVTWGVCVGFLASTVTGTLSI